MRTKLLSLLLILAGTTPAAALDVTGCPFVVPPGEVGVVQNDIDCAEGAPDEGFLDGRYGIMLERGARLDLNGHTVTLLSAPPLEAPIACRSVCEVHGPGTVETSTGEGVGISVRGNRRAKIRDLEVLGFSSGIVASGRAEVTNVLVDAAISGIAGRVLDLHGVDVTLPGAPFDLPQSGCIEATQSNSRVTGEDVTLSGCWYGVYGTRRVKLSGLTVTGSNVGVFSVGVVDLTSSSVTGSESADLYTARPPRLTSSACDTSLQYLPKLDAPGGTWGVCQND